MPVNSVSRRVRSIFARRVESRSNRRVEPPLDRRFKAFSLLTIASLATSLFMAPAAQASGFIFVDPAFHAPVVPVTPLATPGITPIRPGRPVSTPAPVNRPVLHGAVSSGLHLEDQDISVELNDHVAKTYIKQTFKNDTDRDLAGTYLFPLPDDATFSSFALHIDGKPIEGQILAAAEARQQYETIVRSMVDPGLLEYADYKTVRARIFPIPKHGTKTVELEYTQLIKADGGMFKYRFPLKSANSDAVNNTKIAMKLASKSGLRTIWSPTHVISTNREGDSKAKVGFESQGEVAEKDFLLFYTVSDKELAASLLTHRLNDENGYFLMALNPPLKAKTVVSKDIVLVADSSGSMRGEKMNQARAALKYFVDSLNDGDRFSLVDFNTDAEAFAPHLLEATAENKKKALSFIEDLEARGGTNISDAIAVAAGILNEKPDAARPAYLVLMTDGQPTVGVTDSAKLIDGVKSARDIRLFDFGVGYDVNTQLLNKLAQQHHGTSQYVDPDENLETALSSFHDKIKSPVLSDVQIAYDGIEVKDIYPRDIKDIFAGSQILLLGRYKNGADAQVKLTGKENGIARAYSFPMAFAKSEAGHSYLPRMWAMRRIGHLTEVAQANNDNKEVVDEIVELSKRYGIISAYTSFLATDPNERNNFRQAAAQPATVDNLVGWAPGGGMGGAGNFRGGASGREARRLSSVTGFNAPRQVQILDERPVVGPRHEATRAHVAGRMAFASASPASTSGGSSGALIPPPPPSMPLSTFGKSIASPGDNAYMASHSYGDEGSAGLPPYFEFSASQRVALGLNTKASMSPGVKRNERRAGSYLPEAWGGDEFVNSKDWSSSGASESKQILARAMSSAEVSGKKAVEVQKVLGKLKAGELDKDTASGAVKVIGDKTFYLVNGFWVDSGFEKLKDPKPEEIEFGSQKYFDLVKLDSAISKYLGAGTQVIVIFKEKCYKIVSPAEVKAATAN